MHFSMSDLRLFLLNNDQQRVNNPFLFFFSNHHLAPFTVPSQPTLSSPALTRPPPPAGVGEPFHVSQPALGDL